VKSHLFIIALLATAPLALTDDTIKSKVVDAETHSVIETIADTKGRILKKTRFYFDEHNWAKSAVHYDTKGAVRYKESFKRNSAGKVLEAWLYSAENKLLGKRIYHYDPSGKVARIDDYDAAGQPIKAQRAEAVSRR
jgi:hypothetical protein